MGKLDRTWGYLSGGIENAKDHGVNWRRHMIQLVHNAGLDIWLVDPTDKPEELGINEEQEYQSNLQKTGKFRELQAFVSEYRRLDIRSVDLSDFLVVVIDPTIPQWGTADETYFAESQHKPTFFICEGGLYRLPKWLFDVIDPIDEDGKTNVYESVEEVVAELVRLDRGEKPLSREWVLLRKVMEERRSKTALLPRDVL